MAVPRHRDGQPWTRMILLMTLPWAFMDVYGTIMIGAMDSYDFHGTCFWWWR